MKKEIGKKSYFKSALNKASETYFVQVVFGTLR